MFWNCLNVGGDVVRAMETIKMAYDIAPNEPKVLWTLAVFYDKQGNNEQAALFGLEAVKNKVKLNNIHSLDYFINYFLALNQYDALVILYEKANSMEPNNLDILQKLIIVYAYSGQKHKAAEKAEKYLKQVPSAANEVRNFLNTF